VVLIALLFVSKATAFAPLRQYSTKRLFRLSGMASFNHDLVLDAFGARQFNNPSYTGEKCLQEKYVSTRVREILNCVIESIIFNPPRRNSS
jgi:hypothetical protein